MIELLGGAVLMLSFGALLLVLFVLIVILPLSRHQSDNDEVDEENDEDEIAQNKRVATPSTYSVHASV